MEQLTRIIGVGSPYGNDQAGWLVATRLAQRPALPAEVLTVASPDEMVPFLEGCSRLIVVDAATGLEAGVHRLEWPFTSDTLATFSSSHAMSIPYLLHITAELNRLPPTVIFYAIVTEQNCGERVPHQACSTEAIRLAEQAVRSIALEIDYKTQESWCAKGKSGACDGNCGKTDETLVQPIVNQQEVEP